MAEAVVASQLRHPNITKTYHWHRATTSSQPSSSASSECSEPSSPQASARGETAVSKQLCLVQELCVADLGRLLSKRLLHSRPAQPHLVGALRFTAFLQVGDYVPTVLPAHHHVSTCMIQPSLDGLPWPGFFLQPGVACLPWPRFSPHPGPGQHAVACILSTLTWPASALACVSSSPWPGHLSFSTHTALCSPTTSLGRARRRARAELHAQQGPHPRRHQPTQRPAASRSQGPTSRLRLQAGRLWAHKTVAARPAVCGGDTVRSGWMPCLALVPAACAVNVCVCVCGGEVASGQGAFLFHPSQFHMHAGGGGHTMH